LTFARMNLKYLYSWSNESLLVEEHVHHVVTIFYIAMCI